MMRILFTNSDSSKSLTVITDGIDSQMNIFATETPIGDIDYFKSLGISIEAGVTYNLGTFKEWAWTNLLKVVAYPEGLQEEAMVLVDDADMEVVYSLSVDPTSLSFPAEGGTQKLISITSVKQIHVDNVPIGKPTNVPYTTAVNGDGFSKGNSDLEVVASENPTEAARNGTLVITQSEGNKTVSVTLTQVAPSAV